MPGVLVYVKISMTGDEPPDVQKYARKDPAFPHQPTDLRQSFDEEQFECYRCLGDHIARDVFDDAGAGRSATRTRGTSRETGTSPRPPELHPGQSAASSRPSRAAGPSRRPTRTSASWNRPGAGPTSSDDLRNDPALADLSRDLYPELSPALDGAGTDPAIREPDRRRAELHAVARMLQVMEEAWLGAAA